MTSLNLKPEQLALLQQRQLISPQVAAQAQQKLAPLNARIASSVPQTVAGPTRKPAQFGFSPTTPQPLPQQTRQMQRRPQRQNRDAEAFAGVVMAFDRGAFTGNSTSVPSAAFPKMLQERADLRGHLDLTRLTDEEFIMALKQVNAGTAGWGDQNKQDLFSKFSAVVQERPTLREKLRKLLAAEQKGRR